MTKKNILLGEFLLEQGLINEEQLSRALKYHNENGVKLGRAFIDLKILKEKDIIRSLSTQLGVQYINLKNYRFDKEVLSVISSETAWNYCVFPLFRLHNRLSVAMVNPLDIYALDELTRTTKLKIEPVIAMEGDILTALAEYYPKEMMSAQLQPEPAAAGDEFPVTIVEQGHEQDSLLAQIDDLLKKLVDHRVFKEVVVADKLRIFKVDKVELWDLPEEMDARSFIRMICNLADDMYPGDRGPKCFQIEKEFDGQPVRFHLFSSSASQYQSLTLHIQMDRTCILLENNYARFEKFRNRKLPTGITIISSPDEIYLNDIFAALLKRAKQDFNNPLSIETKSAYLDTDVLQLTCIHKNEQLSAMQFAAISGVDCLFLKDIRDSYTLGKALNLAETGTAVVIALQAANPWELFQTILSDVGKTRLAHQLRQIYINYAAERILTDKPEFMTTIKKVAGGKNGRMQSNQLLESFWIRKNSDTHGDEALIFEQAASELRKKLREAATNLIAPANHSKGKAAATRS